MLGVLTINMDNKRSEYTPIQLAGFGGAAVGSASISMLSPLSLELNLTLGGGVGFFVGLVTSVMKQYLAPVNLVPACTIAFTGAALLAGVGFLVGGTTGWAAAGGISLSWVAILAESLRREPALEIDANEQPVRVIPRREMCWRTAQQSWSLYHSLAWGWHGLFGGLLASLWAFWAANHPDVRAIH